MGLETSAVLAIVALVGGAVGTGIQYSAAQDAARTQEQFALLNASAQTAQASMSERLATAQAALQAQQSANAAEAGAANSAALKDEAAQKARESQINIARDMEDQLRFRSMLRAKGGASGTVSGGSQLDLLAKSAELQALENGESEYQTVQQQRQLFREAENARQGGEYASIQSDLDLISGEAAASAYRAKGIQAQIEGLSGVSAARGASLAALGGAVGGFSNLGLSAFNLNRLGALRFGTGGASTAGAAFGLTPNSFTHYGA